MRKGVRIALWIAGTAATVIATVILFGMGRKARRAVSCVGLRVEFADSGRFVSSKDVEDCLYREYGIFEGTALDSLDLGRVEEILNSNSAVDEAQAYTTPDGMLNVRIRQMEPVVRFRSGARGFYADRSGRVFPLQKSFTADVCVVEGDIPLNFKEGFKGFPEDPEEKRWLDGMVGFVRYLNSSKIWKGFFRSFLINGDGELVLVPAQGRERFIFGEPDNQDAKFRKIADYYTAIVPEKGAGFYSSVNVKFNGQIVCRK